MRRSEKKKKITPFITSPAIGVCALLIIAILIQFPSCTWDKAPFNGEGGVCYQTEIEPIINSNCAMSGCHDGSDHEAPPLTSYTEVLKYVKPGKPDKSKIVESITGQSEEFMPPSPNPPLSQNQIDIIRQWILEGAGNDPGCAFSLPCDSTVVTFSSTVFPIIETNCLGCHADASTGGGILLTNYNQITDQIDRVWGSINHSSSYQPMPKGAAKLTDCDITRIGIWIDDGMLNN